MKLTKHVYTIDEIKSIVKPIVSKYDIQKVYVFGSYARGEATYKSDIDLFIEGYIYHKRLNIANLLVDLEDTLHKRFDIISKEDILHNLNKDTIHLHKNIIDERVVVYER